MSRSSQTRAVIATNLAFCFVVLLGRDICLAQTVRAPVEIFPLSPEYAPGVNVRRTVPPTLQWEQGEYPPTEGIEVVVRILIDPRVDPQKRSNALKALNPFAHKLRNTDHIPELIALYDTCRDEGDRRMLVGTLSGSTDPRALPVLARCLKEATDEVESWQCAGGLARWNIRQGVAALIELSKSQKLSPEGQSFADIPVGTLLGLNRDKGWGLHDAEIVKEIDNIKPKVNDKERRLLLRSEIKKWFEANKDRFPDWKVGDPLPVVEETTPESVHASPVAPNHWTCLKSCAAPAASTDCIACCATYDACMTCFANSFPKVTTPEFRKRHCDSAFNP